MERRLTAPPPWVLGLLAALVVVAARWVAVWAGHGGVIDDEEGVVPAVAQLLHYGSVRDAFGLQFRGWCGGCTLEAVQARALFRVLPDTVTTWRWVPIGYDAILALSVWWLVRRAAGTRAAWVATALLAWPLPALDGLMLHAWGNHLEATALALASLACLAHGRVVGAGLLAALATWVVPTGAPLVLAAVPWLALQRRGRDLALWTLAAAAVVPVWVAEGLWANTNVLDLVDGTATLGSGGLALGSRLASLVAPGQLGHLFARGDVPWLALGVVGTAVPMAVRAVSAGGEDGLTESASVARLAAWAGALWLGAYLVGPATLNVLPADGVAAPFDLRYATPLLVLAVALTAMGAGRVRPVWAAVVVAAWLAPAIVTWTMPLPTIPGASPAARWDRLRWSVFTDVHRLPQDWTCDQGPCVDLLAFARGATDMRANRPVPPPGDVAAWAGLGASYGIYRADLAGSPDALDALDATLAAAGAGPDDRAVALAEAARVPMTGGDGWGDAFDRAEDTPGWRATAFARGAHLDMGLSRCRSLPSAPDPVVRAYARGCGMAAWLTTGTLPTFPWPAPYAATAREGAAAAAARPWLLLP